MATREINNASA